nr:type II secretion system protein N [Polymorphobacter sp.]
MAIGGGLMLAGVLVWFLRGPAPEERAFEAPVLVAPVEEARVLAPALVAPPLSLSGLVLRGIFQRPDGAAAIIEQGGRQRLVRVGSEVMPGVRVERIGGHSVTLVAGSARQELAFADAPAAGDAAGVADLAAVSTATASAPLAGLAASVADYRIGLKARKADGRIIGFELVDAARLPLFRKAELRAGDVILSVNGNALQSEEKIIDLPNEVAGAYSAEIIYLRDGKQQASIVNIDRKS